MTWSRAWGFRFTFFEPPEELIHFQRRGRRLIGHGSRRGPDPDALGPPRDSEAPLRPEPAEATLPEALLDCSPPMEYPVETFSEEEQARLAPHFTNLDRPVFALVGLPETVKGALFARYSRYQGTLRRLYLDEFAGDVAPAAPARGRGRARGPALRADLPRLRRRLGRAARRRARRVRVGLERPHEDPPAPAARRLPRAVHALHRLRRARCRAAATATGATPSSAPSTSAAMDSLFDTYARSLPRGRGVGGRPLPARRQRAGVGVPALDQGEGARPAARPAAGGLAVAHGHLRQRPGLRAARAAPDGLAAAGGARVRLDDPVRAEQGDPELPRARRAARARRRVGRVPARARRGGRALGRALRARPRPRARARRRRRCGCSRCAAREDDLLAALLFEADVRVRGGDPRARSACCRRTSASSCSPSWSASAPTAATAPAAASRRSATASRWSPTTARSATSSATACSPCSGSRSRRTWAPGCPRSSSTPACRRLPRRARPLARRVRAAGRRRATRELAPYALCLGYRIRYILDMNAREAMHLIELRSGREGHPAYRAVAHELHAQIAAVHPRDRGGDEARGPRDRAAARADPAPRSARRRNAQPPSRVRLREQPRAARLPAGRAVDPRAPTSPGSASRSRR